MLKILKIYNEFADKNKDVKDTLRNTEDQRIENLVMIFLWRDTTIVNHWCSELYSVCHKVPKFKSNNKYPKYNFILQHIWLTWEDCYYDRLRCYISDVERKENRKTPKFNKESLYNFMKDYHEWLAKQLSTKGDVTFSEVKDKINKLLDRYNRL